MNDEKPKRVVLMFKPRFAPLVKAGTKRQTIRPLGKRKVEPGMIADCREWTGNPYRSKQRKLREGKIIAVNEIVIDSDLLKLDVKYDGQTLHLNQTQAARDQVARLDGFRDWPEMREWFDNEHGLPFKGRMILWE